MFGSLVTPCDTARLEALVNANGHVIWDLQEAGQDSLTAARLLSAYPGRKIVDFLKANVSKSDLSDVLWKSKDWGDVIGRETDKYKENSHR